jgi:hypothetical protein
MPHPHAVNAPSPVPKARTKPISAAAASAAKRERLTSNDSIQVTRRCRVASSLRLTAPRHFRWSANVFRLACPRRAARLSRRGPHHPGKYAHAERNGSYPLDTKDADCHPRRDSGSGDAACTRPRLGRLVANLRHQHLVQRLSNLEAMVSPVCIDRVGAGAVPFLITKGSGRFGPLPVSDRLWADFSQAVAVSESFEEKNALAAGFVREDQFLLSEGTPFLPGAIALHYLTPLCSTAIGTY